MSAKLNAAREALKFLGGVDVIGVGSGSTVKLFLQELSRLKTAVTCVPSSLDTLEQLARLGFPVTTLLHARKLRVAFDGADQVDASFNMAKGGGGALTMEKIVDYSSELLVVMIEKYKIVDTLGKTFPLPIELIPDAFPLVEEAVRMHNGQLLPRTGSGKVGPVITDNGLMLADAKFPDGIPDPKALEGSLKTCPGVLEVGLFTKHPNVVLVIGDEAGAKVKYSRKL